MEIKQNKLVIRQKIEALEIFTDFETKNKYQIEDKSGNQIFYAYEESGFFTRHFLGSIRPTKIIIIDNNKKPLLTIEKDIHFIRANYKIKDPSDNLIGEIKQKKWMMNPSFEVFDSGNNLLYTCQSKVPHIWTYNIFKDGNQVGQILKKWAGGREVFTDADKFYVDFGSISNQIEKQLILGAAFAIDLRMFEHK